MGESQVLRSGDIDWDRAIFWPADLGDPSTLLDGDVSNQQLMRQNAVLVAELRRLTDLLGDYSEVRRMLRAWRRIVIGIMTAFLGTLTPYIINLLRMLGLIP